MAKKRKRAADRCVLVNITDLHSGHQLGLLNPDTVLWRANPGTGQAEPWTPELTATQERLWDIYTESLGDVQKFVGSDPVVVFVGGDATNGDVYPNGTIPGTSYSDQRIIARYNLRPLAQLSTLRAMRLITGTYVHVHDSAEAKIAAKLAKENLGRNIGICHHARAIVDGVVVDVAHHGPHPGTRDWLHGNVALYYLRDRIYRDRRSGKAPARLYLRHHYHTLVVVPFCDQWEGDWCRSELAVVPSMCGFTDHARQVTRSDPFITNGLLMWEIVGGKLGEVIPLTDTVDLRTEETL